MNQPAADNFAVAEETAFEAPMIIESVLGDEDLALVDDLPPMSAATASIRFSVEDSEGDGLSDDEDDGLYDDDDDFEDLGGDDLEED